MPLVFSSKLVGGPSFVVEADREAILVELVNAEHLAVLRFQVDRARLLVRMGDVGHFGENRPGQSQRERLVGDEQADAILLAERLVFPVLQRHRNGIGLPGPDQRRGGRWILGRASFPSGRRCRNKQKQRDEGRRHTGQNVSWRFLLK